MTGFGELEFSCALLQRRVLQSMEHVYEALMQYVDESKDRVARIKEQLQLIEQNKASLAAATKASRALPLESQPLLAARACAGSHCVSHPQKL